MSTKEAFKNESPFVRVGTTLYKIVNQPRLNGGHIKKRKTGDISRNASYGTTKHFVKIMARII